MRDPVFCVGDGHTYEREAVEGWFHMGKATSPLTGAVITSTSLVPNHAMRAAIEAIHGPQAPFLKAQEPGPGKQEGSRSSPYAAGEGGVACLASASSECYVVSGGSHGLYSGLGEMRAWRCESWERVQQLQESAHAGQLTCLAAAASGAWFASSSRDRSVCIWDTESWTSTHALQGHSDWVYCCAVAPSEEWLVSGSRDCSLRVWSRSREAGSKQGAPAWRCSAQRTTPGWVNCCLVRPNSYDVVTGGDDWALRVWDSDRFECVSVGRGHTMPITSCAASADAQVFATSSADRSVCVWDQSTWTPAQTLQGHQDAVTCLAVCPYGRWIVSGSKDCMLRVWDTRSSRCLHSLGRDTKTSESSQSISCCAVAPEGEWVVCGGENGVMRILNTRDWSQVSELTGPAVAVSCCAFVKKPSSRRFV